jgi:pimeloyl-ACP methyl ester carboxylesterase
MLADLIEIVTPRQYQLHGMWIGPQDAKTVFIHLHGLTSNMFNGLTISSLIDKSTAVLAFNNRGREIVSKLKHLNNENPKGYDSEIAGTAHEIFEDCVDDIEGAVNLVKSKGSKNIYLVGHSTGCQKSAFYLAETKNKQSITGIVLLCPLSDYAVAMKFTDPKRYKKGLDFAKKEVQAGRPHTLLSKEIWADELLDAQRFLSLYTVESKEEIFTYSHNKKNPTTFQSLFAPVLVVLAGADEYSDRPAEKIQDWFDKNHHSKKYKSVVIEGAPHNLKGSEKEVCREIQSWISE